MHLILTGATGLVGSAVLQTMLANSSVTKISILSRRPVAQADGHMKATVIIHKDYNTYPPSVLSQLKDADGVIWAQGISATQVTKPEYETIMHDYPLAFARAISTTTAPKPINFVYVSGEGSTTTPGMLTQHWQRIKGLAESNLLGLSKESQYSNLRPFTLRPGGVDPTEHTEIHKFLPKKTGIQGWPLEKVLLPAVRYALPRFMSPTRDLGKVLVELAMGDGSAFKEGEGISGEGRTLNNHAMRVKAGLEKS